jgi:hypothetical protein
MAAASAVATLLEALLLQSPASGQDVPGETLDPGLPDRTMASLMVSLYLLGHRLGTHDA